jgi:hypothetical protein
MTNTGNEAGVDMVGKAAIRLAMAFAVPSIAPHGPADSASPI